MPDYAPHFTPRLHWLYTVQGKNHVATFRFQREFDPADAPGLASEVADCLNPFYTVRGYLDLATRGWEFAATDSTVFLPVVTAATVEGGASITGRPINQVAMQLTLPYRTVAGGHGFINLYGTNYNVYGSPEQDFRVLGSEDEDLAAMINALSIIGLRGNDNEIVVLKPYGNIGFNARWKRKVRNG
jgi:hypothetical protein